MYKPGRRERPGQSRRCTSNLKSGGPAPPPQVDRGYFETVQASGKCGPSRVPLPR